MERGGLGILQKRKQRHSEVCSVLQITWLDWGRPETGIQAPIQLQDTPLFCSCLMTENEMVGWHHWLNGHEFEPSQGDSEGQGSLVCCSPGGCEAHPSRHKQLNISKKWFFFLLKACWMWGYNTVEGLCMAEPQWLHFVSSISGPQSSPSPFCMTEL